MARLRCALSRVELLVMIAIIGLIVAIVLPAIQTTCKSARRALRFNNLEQIGTALQSDHSHKRTFPLGYKTVINPQDADDSARLGLDGAGTAAHGRVERLSNDQL